MSDLPATRARMMRVALRISSSSGARVLDARVAPCVLDLLGHARLRAHGAEKSLIAADYEVSSGSDALRGVDPVAQVVSEQGQRIAAHLDQPRDGPGADLILEASLIEIRRDHDRALRLVALVDQRV
jgi:hypothetical protein